MKNISFKIMSSRERSRIKESFSLFSILIICIGIPIGILFLPIKSYLILIYLFILLVVNKLLTHIKFKGKRTTDIFNECIIFNKENIVLKLENEEIIFNNMASLRLAIKYVGYENETELIPGNIYFNTGISNKVEIIHDGKHYIYNFISTEADDYNNLYIFMAKILPENVDCKLTVKGHLEFVRINGKIVNPKEHKKTWHW